MVDCPGILHSALPAIAEPKFITTSTTVKFHNTTESTDDRPKPRRVATIGKGKPGLPSISASSDGDFHVVWNQGVRGDSHIYYAKLVP